MQSFTMSRKTKVVQLYSDQGRDTNSNEFSNVVCTGDCVFSNIVGAGDCVFSNTVCAGDGVVLPLSLV